MNIHTIAVIGAGEVGREFACAALLAGYRTILEDVSDGRLQLAAAWIANSRNLGPKEHSRLVLAGNIEQAVREADLIVEAVAEEMEMKIEMFTIFDKFAKPDAILASSSASFAIAELAAVTFCPERCVGLRFIAGPAGEGALQVALTAATSAATVAACRQVARRMGREAVVLDARV